MMDTHTFAVHNQPRSYRNQPGSAAGKNALTLVLHTLYIDQLWGKCIVAHPQKFLGHAPPLPSTSMVRYAQIH